VALHFEAKDALEAQRGMLRGEGLPVGEGALVFPSTSGTPMKSDNLRKRHLGPALGRAGLPYVTLHELRHTFASIMLHEWMVPPAVVSKMMGHKSIAFTFDLYGHLIPSAQSDVMRRLNAEQGGPGRGDRPCRFRLYGIGKGKPSPLQGGGRWFEPSIAHFTPRSTRCIFFTVAADRFARDFSP
jgi:hypothetical protein